MAENIINSEKPSSSSPLEPPSRVVCHVCQKQFSQYTCPRCNSRYCSLHCYKSHSLRCTESFMRENVAGELRNLKPNDETKGKMLDILKRFHHSEEEETEDMDEEDSILSEKTIQKVLSEGQIDFDDLSIQEKRQFQRAIASGELSKTIEPWDPWWLSSSARSISLSREGTQLVQPITNDDEEEKIVSQSSENIPAGPTTPLPPLSTLTSSDPSPLLHVHLVDVLYSYCFTLRLYNGDWKSDPIGSASVVLTLSSVLGQGGQPETVSEALSYCLEQTCSPGYRHLGGPPFRLGIIDDVASLVALGGKALLCALSDVRRLVEEGEKESRESRRRDVGRKLKFAGRKVYFMMCWVGEQPQESWSALAAIVKAEKALATECSGVVDKRKRGGNPSKVLIEEIE